jgi:hypothetical protein
MALAAGRPDNATVTVRGYALCALMAVTALLAASCGGSSHVRSAAQVERALRSAGLQPQRTTITMELESVDGTTPKTVPIQEIVSMPASEDRPPPVFMVDHGRALVYVYPTEEAAAPYTAAPRGHVLVVRNVVAVTVHGTLSRRVRAVLARLA